VGLEIEVNDWSEVGADCTTQTDSVFSGTLNSVANFDWIWVMTWSYVAGDACDAAMEMRCTYEGIFHMEWESLLEE
jgi:hypothetical protein